MLEKVFWDHVEISQAFVASRPNLTTSCLHSVVKNSKDQSHCISTQSCGESSWYAHGSTTESRHIKAVSVSESAGKPSKQSKQCPVPGVRYHPLLEDLHDLAPEKRYTPFYLNKPWVVFMTCCCIKSWFPKKAKRWLRSKQSCPPFFGSWLTSLDRYLDIRSLKFRDSPSASTIAWWILSESPLCWY